MVSRACVAMMMLPVTNTGPPGLGWTWGNTVSQRGALGVTMWSLEWVDTRMTYQHENHKNDLVSWATGGLVILQGQAMYSGRSELTSLAAASLTVLELFIGLSGAETMNR